MQELRQGRKGTHGLLGGQQGVRAGGTVEGKGALAAGGDADDSLRGQTFCGLIQTGRVHAFTHEHGAQVASEGVAAHLADEAGGSAEPRRCNGHVGRRAARIGGKVLHLAFVHVRLRQIDQKLAQSQ